MADLHKVAMRVAAMRVAAEDDLNKVAPWSDGVARWSANRRRPVCKAETEIIYETVENPVCKVEIEIVYQTVENLHKAMPNHAEALPNHAGYWYFTGDYPTEGGAKVCCRVFVSS